MSETDLGAVARATIADAVERSAPAGLSVGAKVAIVAAVGKAVEESLDRRWAAKERVREAEALDQELRRKDAEAEKVTEIDGLEVLTRVAIYVVGVYGSRWQIRRALRKKDAPEWAVHLAGHLSLIVGARSWADTAELTGKGGEQVGAWFTKQIEAIAERLA